MRVMLIGASGFIGRNVASWLQERGHEIVAITRESHATDLKSVATVDFVIHCAGVNRPNDPSEFVRGNVDLTRAVCDAIEASERRPPILYCSSIQVSQDNLYGKSKRDAENVLSRLNETTDCPVYIVRLPNVFGKWSRPNYNSVVATFCHNAACNIELRIDRPDVLLRLVYIDDVVRCMMSLLQDQPRGLIRPEVSPVYEITVADLANTIRTFAQGRSSCFVERVGTGLTRALYSTFVSFLGPRQAVYPLKMHHDARGTFAEVLKTRESGQVSFLTARPNVTRGGHYHHSKVEKFVVLKGHARFRFRHVITGEYVEYSSSAEVAEVVETIPGWSHDITNVGEEELIVMVWANEVFDPSSPDTIIRKVQS